MNKTDIIAELAQRHFGGNKVQATRALNAVVETIAYATATDGKAAISGFGVFEKVHKDARVVRNPKTGTRVAVNPVDLCRFRPGTGLKAVVSGTGDWSAG